MKVKKLRWVVVLMSLATIVLVMFQYQWIRTAAKTNEQQFDKQVIHALNEVSKQVASQESLGQTLNVLSRIQKDSGHFESEYEFRVEDLETVEVLHTPKIRVFRNDVFNLPLEGRTDSLNRIKEREVISESRNTTMISSSNAFVELRTGDNEGMSRRIEFSNQDTTNNRLWTIVVDEQAFYNPRPISERVNHEMMDTLLTQAFANQGIDLPFDYGVIDLKADSVVLSSVQETPLLKASPYKVGLFRMDMNIPQPAMLTVNFPQKSTFLLRKVGATLAASILVLGVILYCFVYAVRTILRQKKLSEIKNDFINNMTHEFKTPVATVSLAVEALQDNSLGDLPDMRQRYLQIIRDENTRLGMQVEKVLQIATLDRRDFKLKIERIDVHEVIAQVLDKINLQVAHREGKLETKLEASSSEVEADPLHLSNIIFNLVDNANKYSPQAPEISVATRSQKDGLWLTVADKGMGMTREVLAKIFDKFYRVPTGNVHDVKGFGLGLAYVKTMVEAHKGEVRVKSQPNQGSMFEIFIPFRHG